MTRNVTNIEATPTTPALDSAVSAAQALLGSLRSAYVARDTESLCLVLALIAEENVLLLGPPGTGKTHLATTFAKALGISTDEVFTHLMGAFTQPDEVFGPLDLPAMKQGIRKRVTTRKMPEAKVAILDEIFKANKGILNSLLTLVNERQFDDGNSRHSVPLEITVGLSNELPEGGPQGPLGALYDRFLFKRWVNYIDTSNPGGAAAWANLMLGGSAPRVAVKLAPQAVAELRQARGQVDLSKVVGTMLIIKTALEDDHGVTISDRRWGKGCKAIQAHAVLHGRTVANADDLSILSECLWDEPEERAVIDQVVAQHADPGYSVALEQADIAREAFAMVPGSSATDAEFGAAAPAASTTIRDAIREMERLEQSSRVAALVEECQGMVRSISAQMNKRMGW